MSDAEIENCASPSLVKSSTLQSMANTTQTLRVKESTIGSRRAVQHQNSLENQNHHQLASPDDLVQYPPDIISTTIERKPGPFWGSSADVRNEDEIQRSLNQLSKLYKPKKSRAKQKTAKAKGNQGFCQDPYGDGDAHVCHSRCSDDVSAVSIISEIDSTFFNHNQETLSVGVQCDEVRRGSVAVQVTTDESSVVFEAKRENANLKGRLESLNYVVEEMSKERSTIQAKIHSLEKDLRAKCNDYDELLSSKQRLLLENEDLKSGLSKWETIVAEYQEVIENKITEVNSLKEDLAKLESENESLKIMVEQLKADSERKEAETKELRKSVVDKDLEIENVCRKNVHLKEEIKYLNTEMDAKCSQRDHYLDEVTKIQTRLTEVQQRMISEQTEALKLKTQLDKVQSENYALKQELIKIKHKTYDEKQLLLKNLEGIGAELLERTTEMKMNNALGDGDKRHNGSVIELSQLEAKETEIQKLKKEAKELRDENSCLAHDKQILTNKVSALQKSLTDMEFNYSTEKCQSEEFETKIRGLKTEMRTLRDFNEMMRKEKAACEEKVTLLSRDNKLLENTTRSLKDTIEKHDRTIKQMRGQLVAKENKLEICEKDRLKAENMIAVRDDEIRSLKDLMQKHSSDNNHRDYYEIKFQKVELEKIVMTLNSEVKSLQVKSEQELLSKTKESECLRAKLEDCTREMKQLQAEVEELRSEKQVLSKKLQEISNRRFSVDESEFSCEGDSKQSDPSNEKIRCLQSNLKLVLRKYKEAKKAREDAEAQFSLERSSMQMVEKPTMATAEVQTEDTQSEDVIAKLNLAVGEVESLKSLLEEKQRVIEESQRTILKFEHDRGRVVHSEDSSLKQQICSLESILSTRNTEVSELTSSLREVEERHKDEVLKLNKRIESLEEELRKERALLKDSRRNVYMEKRESNQLKRDIASLKKGLSDSNQIADKRKQEMSLLEAKLEEQMHNETKLRTQIEELTLKLDKSKTACENLRTEMQQSDKRDNALLHEVKNLSLTLKEKNQEIKGIKLDIDLIQKKHDNEKKVLQDKVESLQTELSSMKSELNTTRKEKFSYQSKVGELRAALKSSVEQNRKLMEQLENQESLSQECNLGNDFINRILEQNHFAGEGKTPLVDLQSCVESLKSEMESLQQQMQEYAN